jgi:hypothetical protein
MFNTLKNKGVIYKNFGKKVEGVFKGLDTIEGIKYKKYVLFKNFNNER